ncbi:MAG: hypothetical protein MUC41_06485 [Syntrophobacteraceae bacterium]|jgi:hypothetical protein|nr:hypothetical protein [Syntrophobacteraceae bacterium]
MLDAKANESAQNGLELDIRTFELEIEKEIDNLFIPLGNDAEIKVQSAPPSMEVEQPKPIVSDTPAAAPVLVESAPGEITLGQVPSPIESTVEVRAVQAEDMASNEADELTLVLESPVEPPDELEQLIESFQASYLSFDWDFSSPNVAALGEVLAKLEPYCLKMPETESLYKIMKAVLQRVSVRPDTISPQLIEVMREAQGLLKRFLLIGKDGISSGDRSELKALIARVQAIRNAQIQKESRPGIAFTAAGAATESEFAASGEATAGGALPAFEGGAEDLGRWIEHSGHHLKTTLLGLQDVNHRLFQLEEILVSKPTLAPLTNRIKSVRLSLEQQVASMRTQESLWSQMTALAHEKGLQFKGDDSVAEGSPHEGRFGVAAESAGRPSADTSAAPSPKRMQREQVCLITLAGRRYAVLSANVVKVQPINGKKMMSISRKGYGLLKDFKPFFKGIKAGLFGTWIGLPAGALKAYQFMPVYFNGLNIAEPVPDDVKGAVLVSNGKQHGIIWSESGSVDLMTETIELTSDSSAILGRIHLDRGEEVQVLHVDQLLEMMHQEETRH